MEPEHFVKSIIKEVVDQNLENYRKVFQINETNEDEYSLAINTVFSSLDDEGKKAFFYIIRQVEVDTVSNILGILDGSSYLNDERPNFILKTSTDDQQLNGDLQDIFLEMEED